MIMDSIDYIVKIVIVSLVLNMFINSDPEEIDIGYLANSYNSSDQPNGKGAPGYRDSIS